MENTLRCPLVVPLILLLTIKGLTVECPQVIRPMACSQDEVFNLQAHSILFYQWCGT